MTIQRRSFAEALAHVPGSQAQRSVSVFEHGTLSVKLYAPIGFDPQTPHTRDEAYVVVSGSGNLVSGQTRLAFEPGDFLFVPAGLEHRFENFDEDLVVWMLLWPEGGNVANGTLVSRGRERRPPGKP